METDPGVGTRPRPRLSRPKTSESRKSACCSPRTALRELEHPKFGALFYTYLITAGAGPQYRIRER